MESNMAQASKAILGETLTQISLSQIASVISGGDCAELLSVVLSDVEHVKASRDEALELLMSKLETLAAFDKSAACTLMAHLWPIASTASMHHVCDAIDLWIADCKSPALAQHLKSMAENEKDAALARHYESWLKFQ